VLLLLRDKEVIKLKDGVGFKPKISDITDNPKKLKFIEIDAAQSPRALDDVDAAAINTNYATQAIRSSAGDAERTVDLDEGDVCNVPIGIYRGFRNAGDDPEATLIAVVGGPDTGKVDWHPSVITLARDTGLAVDDDGNLVVNQAAE